MTSENETDKSSWQLWSFNGRQLESRCGLYSKTLKVNWHAYPIRFHDSLRKRNF